MKSVLLSLIIVASFGAFPAAGQDFSGKWKGNWTSSANGRNRAHSGPLRVRLASNGDGSYRGVFAGRFAVVIPYVYRATVYQNGIHLSSTRRLGPMGEYRMQLIGGQSHLRGGWQAAGESGTIVLSRR